MSRPSPGPSPRLRREVHSGCLMKGLLRLISVSRGLLCELSCFERYVAHYAGIVGSRFKHSRMIHIGAVCYVCQRKLPPFPPQLGINSAEGHRGHKICLLLHFTGRKIRCLKISLSADFPVKKTEAIFLCTATPVIPKRVLSVCISCQLSCVRFWNSPVLSKQIKKPL